MEIVGELPERISVHLDRGYDSKVTRERLQDRGFLWEISQKGKPAPLAATKRWVVERTNSWSNAHKKLVWCTERVDRVIDFWLALVANESGNQATIRRGDAQQKGHIVSGHVPLLASSRQLTEAERRAFRSRRGYDPTEMPVALDAVGIYVNRDRSMRSSPTISSRR